MLSAQPIGDRRATRPTTANNTINRLLNFIDTLLKVLSAPSCGNLGTKQDESIIRGLAPLMRPPYDLGERHFAVWASAEMGLEWAGTRIKMGKEIVGVRHMQPGRRAHTLAV